MDDESCPRRARAGLLAAGLRRLLNRLLRRRPRRDDEPVLWI